MAAAAAAAGVEAMHVKAFGSDVTCGVPCASMALCRCAEVYHCTMGSPDSGFH